jgi:hypothetical protein
MTVELNKISQIHKLIKTFLIGERLAKGSLIHSKSAG